MGAVGVPLHGLLHFGQFHWQLQYLERQQAQAIPGQTAMYGADAVGAGNAIGAQAAVFTHNEPAQDGIGVGHRPLCPVVAGRRSAS